MPEFFLTHGISNGLYERKSQAIDMYLNGLNLPPSLIVQHGIGGPTMASIPKQSPSKGENPTRGREGSSDYNSGSLTSDSQLPG